MLNCTAMSSWEAQEIGNHLEGRTVGSSTYILMLKKMLKYNGVKFIFRGVDVKKLKKRYKYPELPHALVLGHTLERINDYAESLNLPDNSVIVSCDEVGTQIEHQTAFVNAKVFGTPCYRSSTFNCISEPLNFLNSPSVRAVQAADLAVYLYRSILTLPREKHSAAQKSRDNLWRQIEPYIVHEWI